MSRVLIGVTGGVAAYKTADLVREIVRGGDEAQVVMTPGATRFVTPLLFSALSGRPALVELFDDERAHHIDHVELGRWADVVVIAPATLDFIGRWARGLAADLLTTTIFALPAQTPILVSPSMNTKMWEHPLFRDNLQRLIDLNERGYRIQVLDPVAKLLACGDEGDGAYPPVERLYESIREMLPSEP